MTKYGREAMLVAGGTDVYPGMKRRIFEPKILIGLRHIQELRKFGWEDSTASIQNLATGTQAKSKIQNGIIQNPKSKIQNQLSLGAGLTLTEVSNHPEIIKRYPALATAAADFSQSGIRISDFGF